MSSLTVTTHCDAEQYYIAQSMTVREAVSDFARQVSMTSIFANPGATELPMFCDLPADVRYVLGLQEAVVVGMADGYAQAAGNAALVNLHSAAGVGNVELRRWSRIIGENPNL